MNNPFDHLIGQDKLKNKLTFGLEGFKRGIPLPHYLFIGPKGAGKTQFAKALAHAIHLHNKNFQAHAINCATLKNVASFYQQIYEPKIVGKKSIIVFDEAHTLPDIIQQLLLTTIEVDDKIERTIPTDNGDMVINMLDHIFIFMTSEPNQLFPPLKDRMEVVALARYETNELGQILCRHVKNAQIQDSAVSLITETLRGNPRHAAKKAKDIVRYCHIKNKTSFGPKEWEEFVKMNDVGPYGLNANEISVLRVLALNGECSLNGLEAQTGISRAAIQNDLEPFLVFRQFMRIDGKRKITEKGRKAWKLIDGEK